MDVLPWFLSRIGRHEIWLECGTCGRQYEGNAHSRQIVNHSSEKADVGTVAFAEAKEGSVSR